MMMILCSDLGRVGWVGVEMSVCENKEEDDGVEVKSNEVQT